MSRIRAFRTFAFAALAGYSAPLVLVEIYQRASGRLEFLTVGPFLVRYTAAGIGRVRRESRSEPGMARNFHPPETFINHAVAPQRTFASATLAFKATVEVPTPAFEGKKEKKLSVTAIDGGLSCNTSRIRVNASWMPCGPNSS